MKKLGPILAIISGVIGIALATLGILIAQDVIKDIKFIGDYTDGVKRVNSSVTTIYIIALVIGILQVMLGMYAIQKPHGFSAFVLLVLFAATTTLAIWAGVKADSWPASSIISISVSGIATIGLLIGFTKGE